MPEEAGGDGTNEIEAAEGADDDDARVKPAAPGAAATTSAAAATSRRVRVYRHGDLAAGDRVINSYAADRTPGSATLSRQGFCVDFSFPRGGRASQQPQQPPQQQEQEQPEQQEPKVKLLLDNGQQISVQLSSARRASHADEVVYGGHPDDEAVWGFAELLKFENSDSTARDLEEVARGLHRRATQVRHRWKERRKEQWRRQEQQEMSEEAGDAAASAAVKSADSATTASATGSSSNSNNDIAMTEEQRRQQQQQRSAALRRKRLELEVAQKKRSLLARKREREEALTAANARKRQKVVVSNLSALRRPAIVVRDISSAGPRELVYIQQKEEVDDTAAATEREAKTRLPTPQREEKKSELRQRQREVLERRAELMRKAEVLKNKKKRKRLDTTSCEDGDDNGDGDDDDAKKRATDDSGTAEDADELDEGIIRSEAASEAENNDDDNIDVLLEDADVDADAGQLEQLRLRRLELQSTISQQAQTQSQLKQSIEVQSLRGMVRAQLGVLTKQGQNLAERTTQLRQCTADMEAERTEVEEAERRLEELLDKKQRLEVMAGRVTEQLLDSRKRRADLLEVAGGSSSNITAGDVEYSIDGEGPDAAAGDTSSGKSRRLSKGQRKRRSAGKRKDAASDFFEE